MHNSFALLHVEVLPCHIWTVIPLLIFDVTYSLYILHTQCLAIKFQMHMIRIKDALVNGHVVHFLIDTGASDVSLTMDDARRLGFDPAKLSFTTQYQTANGITLGARVTIDEIKVGDITVRNVAGSVMQDNAGASLLGMSFLNALGSYEFRGDRLVLHR